MAKAKLNKKQIQSRMDKAIGSVNYDRVGRFVINHIKKMVRSGISPVTGKPFKALKQKTIDRRKQLSENNRTHPKYGSDKSNLTFSGQLLNALRFSTFFSGGFATLRIFTNPTVRRPYKNKNGTRQKPSNNEDVQEGVEKLRPYLGLDKDGKEKLNNIISNEIKKELRKLNRR